MEIVVYLLGKGASINLADMEGDTALFACETREMAEFLIANGANIHARNFNDQTVFSISQKGS